MARTPLDHDELLAISRQSAAVFVEAGGSSPTVACLAETAGISERTFYRYFPTKEDVLRPVFDAGNHAFATALTAQPRRTELADAVVNAFDLTFASSTDAEARDLMTVVFADPALRRIWLQAAYETTDLIRTGVARLLGTGRDDLTTTVACGQAVLLVTVALQHLIRDDTPLTAAARIAAAAMFSRH